MNYPTWFDTAKEQAKLGYLPYGSYRTGDFTQYTHLFVKNNQKPTTYSLDLRYLYETATADQIVAALNDMGSKGCRLQAWSTGVFLGHGAVAGMNTNTFDIASCSNSSTHHGTYQYRYVKNPEALQLMDPTELDKIIKTQQKDGYRLISTRFYVSLNDRMSLLFERDSENLTPVEYKVFKESVFDSSATLADLNRRLNEQNKLGWLLTADSMLYSNDPKAIFINSYARLLP